MLATLLEALDDFNAEVRSQARQQLIQIGTGAVDELILALQSDKLRLAWQAGVVLGQIPDPRWTAPMADALQSPNTLLGQAAVTALEDNLGAEAVPYLLNAIPDCRLVVQIAAINALERIGSTEAVEPLTSILESTEVPELRYNIIQALGAIGDATLIPLVMKFENDSNHHVRERVALAVERLKDR